MKERIIFVVVLGWIVTAGLGGQSRAIVDFDAEVMRSLPLGDSIVLSLVGNVAFHHNGAIITCDSAIRYNERYIECYDNVIINKDSTYVYGDRADFNGITNIAKVFAPIIKLVDQDVTMYSYDLEFNTLTNIGRYTQGGTISQLDNLMESIEATYHGDERDVFFSREVVMQNDEYLIETDSMGYNFDSEITTFYKPAKIWNADGDILMADRGSYNRQSDVYIFNKDSYILTDEQEVWADSMIYMKEQEIIHMYRDIQINEEEHNTMLFGDYGVYWAYDEHAIMADNPSVISWEEGPETDSVYMRADSIFFFTLPMFPPMRLDGQGDTVGVDSPLQFEYPDFDLEIDSLGNFIGYDFDDQEEFLTDSLASSGTAGTIAPPEDGPENPDGENSPETDQPGETEAVAPEKTKKEMKRERREQKRAAKALPKTPPRADDTVVREGDGRREGNFTGAYAVPDSLEIVNDTLPVDSPGWFFPTDSLGMPEVDSLLTVDSLMVEEPVTDSVQRIVRAFRDVRIFREDVQAVCDSLVSFSRASTVRLYIDPVMWSENSQLKSNEMTFFSKNEELEHAEFEGQPIMIEHVRDSLYNQVAGKIMYAYFADNAIDRLDVNGNAQTLYYMQESDSDDIGGFMVLESANISFYFDSSRVSTITYRVDPEWAMYPMDKIPANQTQYLSMFKWMPERRPMRKEDVFDRVIRPSIRQEVLLIPMPDFPITEKINEDRLRFTEEGIWRDRNDLPGVTPEFFAVPPPGF